MIIDDSGHGAPHKAKYRIPMCHLLLLQCTRGVSNPNWRYVSLFCQVRDSGNRGDSSEMFPDRLGVRGGVVGFGLSSISTARISFIFIEFPFCNRCDIYDGLSKSVGILIHNHR